MTDYQQKNGISALGLQRVLGLGSYKTAWAMLHKLRRAMVRPGRDRLDGVVEVDETYWGGEEPGAIGRQTELKALIIVAAEEEGKGIGRIRLRSIPDVTKATLHGSSLSPLLQGARFEPTDFLHTSEWRDMFTTARYKTIKRKESICFPMFIA